jgi:hypothetical protein
MMVLWSLLVFIGVVFPLLPSETVDPAELYLANWLTGGLLKVETINSMTPSGLVLQPYCRASLRMTNSSSDVTTEAPASISQPRQVLRGYLPDAP